jgi:hypothetical protein
VRSLKEQSQESDLTSFTGPSTPAPRQESVVPDSVIEETAIPRDAQDELVHTLHEQLSSMRKDMHSKEELITQLPRRAQNEVESRLEVPESVIEEKAIPRDARDKLIDTLHEQVSSMRRDMHCKNELITQWRRRAQNRVESRLEARKSDHEETGSCNEETRTCNEKARSFNESTRRTPRYKMLYGHLEENAIFASVRDLTDLRFLASASVAPSPQLALISSSFMAPAIPEYDWVR